MILNLTTIDDFRAFALFCVMLYEIMPFPCTPYLLTNHIYIDVFNTWKEGGYKESGMEIKERLTLIIDEQGKKGSERIRIVTKQ